MYGLNILLLKQQDELWLIRITIGNEITDVFFIESLTFDFHLKEIETYIKYNKLSKNFKNN